MSALPSDADLFLPFPIEFIIQDTPVSHQAKIPAAKERWKQTVGQTAKTHVSTLGEFFFLDDRPLAATIFYFPVTTMQGDIDNVVKLILDGMTGIIYPNDQNLERIVVQKFEPEIPILAQSPTPTLAYAVGLARPVVYVRIDDDRAWRSLL